MVIIDIVVLAVIGFFAFSGLVKGFVKGMFGIVTFLGSLIVAFLLVGTVAPFVSNLIQIEGQSLIAHFSDQLVATLSTADVPTEVAAILNGQVSALDANTIGAALGAVGVPGILTGIISGPILTMISGAGLLPETTVVAGLSPVVVTLAVQGIVFLVLFIISVAILSKLRNFFKAIVKKSSLLRFIDRLLGLALGAVVGAFIIWGIFTGINSVEAISSFINPILDPMIADSTFAIWFFNNNWLDQLIAGTLNFDQIIADIESLSAISGL